MTTFDWRHAKAEDVAQALDADPELAGCGLHAALANALERIAALERERHELGELLKAFNETIDASALHAPAFSISNEGSVRAAAWTHPCP